MLASPVVSGADEDGVVLRNAPQQCARLANSEILNNLLSYLIHLSIEQKSDIVQLISKLPSLFSDIPRQTNILQHDIKLYGVCPIKSK